MVKNKKPKATKKSAKPRPVSMDKSVDSLHRRVKEITINRKEELQENPELTTALCALADYVGQIFMKVVEPSIMTDDELIKKKDMLLVLQLTYLRLCSDILESGEQIELVSDIPISGLVKAAPIDTKKDSVPIYC